MPQARERFAGLSRGVFVISFGGFPSSVVQSRRQREPRSESDLAKVLLWLKVRAKFLAREMF